MSILQPLKPHFVVPMPVASPERRGTLDGMGADTAVCEKEKTRETNHER